MPPLPYICSPILIPLLPFQHNPVSAYESERRAFEYGTFFVTRFGYASHSFLPSRLLMRGRCCPPDAPPLLPPFPGDWAGCGRFIIKFSPMPMTKEAPDLWCALFQNCPTDTHLVAACPATLFPLLIFPDPHHTGPA